jgi:GNAT superfamily N-acetyltransferase
MGEEGKLVLPRLARGSRCFVVWIDDSVGGYGWLSVNPEWISEIQLKITPRPGEGYIWNCVTLVEHRRKGIFRSLLIGISEVARTEGLTRMWVATTAIPAERALGSSGFKRALRFMSVTMGGLHLLTISPSDPSLGAAASAVLSIRPGIHVRRTQARRH